MKHNGADTALARALGLVSPDGLYWHAREKTYAASPPHFSTEWDICHEAESEIARRGLLVAYAAAVLVDTDIPPFDSGGDPRDVNGRRALWERAHLIIAPPDVRVRAMLRALGIEEETHQ